MRNDIGLHDVGIDHLRAFRLGVVAPHQEGRLDPLVERDVVQQEISRALDDLVGRKKVGQEGSVNAIGTYKSYLEEGEYQPVGEPKSIIAGLGRLNSLDGGVHGV